ncbi:uncharacterized protein LOC110441944 isoform X2 [Mizuhopecten yessoensis]|uniref:uncharacterized protein LOC110441944 isoform X2 n=1 Tax=Mizuhopecten yessoensis TaxID=6573 RepID=UPI000B45F1E7|nr:uncharacterized protein LOC110441944 isoform X2 [Mizuhopecten yessoensis]
MFLSGVHLEEPTSPITKQLNEDLDEFVRQLTHPKGTVDRSQSIDVSALDKLGKMKLESSQSSGRDATSQNVRRSAPEIAEIEEKHICEAVNNPRKSWRKHILQRRNGKSISSGTNSTDIDEAVEISFGSNDDEGLDVKEISFDSTSSGLRDSKVLFHGDSTPEDSDQESTPTQVSKSSTLYGQKYVKKDKDTQATKESKRRRFRRMITRPLRRSQSAGCEQDIPAHALFLHRTDEASPEKDTIESRAADLSMYQRQLFGDVDADADSANANLPRRPVHKTCSADAAMMAKEDFGIASQNNNSQPRPKSRNIAKNMKRKFQFLRRRNTDTALVGSLLSVHSRPTSDQASQWSHSFDTLLGDKYGIELFKGFLRSEFSEENLEFWIACQDFRTCKDSKLMVQAQKIYADFIAFQAPKEVNLDSKTRMQAISNLDTPSSEIFLEAQKRIQALMEKDSYPRFLESDIYLQLVNLSDSTKS